MLENKSNPAAEFESSLLSNSVGMENAKEAKRVTNNDIWVEKIMLMASLKDTESGGWSI